MVGGLERLRGFTTPFATSPSTFADSAASRSTAVRLEFRSSAVMAPGDRELLVLAVVVMVVVIWRVLPSVDAVELLAWLPAGRCRCRRRRKLAAMSAACFQIVILKARNPPRKPARSGAGNPGRRRARRGTGPLAS